MAYNTSLFFSGQVLISVDDKGRVKIPAVFLNQMSEKAFHISRGPEKFLWVYPREKFIEMAKKIDKELDLFNPEDREKRSYFLEVMADAYPVQCDSRDRIKIPKELCDFASLKDKVLIIGTFDKLTFWDPDVFDSWKKSGGRQ